MRGDSQGGSVEAGRSGRRVRRLGGALLVLALAGGALLASTGCLASFGKRADPARLKEQAQNAPYEEGRFRNVEPVTQPGLNFRLLMQFFFRRGNRTPPGPLPLVDPREAWRTPPASGLRVTWLGHSTLLVESEGRRVLTDPIWSERASPSTWVGPRRFHPPPVALAELPVLDAVLISHDHYDHLDMETIKQLAARQVPFLVPLGLGAHLESWGVPRGQITELDWWGEASFGELTLVATPARHFSGRSLADRNTTLWASWVIRTPGRRVYFSGDTGLTDQFAEIGRRHGPFDLVMLEVGAFHPAWGDLHLGSHNAVRAHALLGGGAFLPIHWSTFDLGVHDWTDPADELVTLSREAPFQLLTPRIGAPLELPPRRDGQGGAQAVERWWETVQPGPRRARSEVPGF